MKPLLVQEEYYKAYKENTKYMAFKAGLSWGIFMFVF